MNYAPLTDQLLPDNISRSFLVPLSEPNLLSPNTSFIGNFQFVWDSVSYGAIQTCPRKYKFSIIDGYQLSPTPSTLLFGIYFHKIQEVWHKLLAHGMDKDLALLRCVRLAGLLGENLLNDRNERTKETLIRATVWYLDQFKNDPAQTNIRPDGTPAVEYSFQLPLFNIDNQTIYLAGHLDRVATFQNSVYLCDYKTTKSDLGDRFLSTFKPSYQFEGYLAAAHILSSVPTSVFPSPPTGLIIDGIQLGVTFTRFQRFIVRITKPEIDEYLTDLEYTIKVKAKGYAEANHWPAEKTSCHLYGGCEFLSVCSKPPQDRERILKTNYVKRTWDPAKAR
jgi:RecB family exonuclease